MQPTGAIAPARSATWRALKQVSPETVSCAGLRDSVKPAWHLRRCAAGA